MALVWRGVNQEAGKCDVGVGGGGIVPQVAILQPFIPLNQLTNCLCIIATATKNLNDVRSGGLQVRAGVFILRYFRRNLLRKNSYF